LEVIFARKQGVAGELLPVNLKTGCKERMLLLKLQWKWIRGRKMTWVLLGLLSYLLVGAALVAWVFSGMSFEMGSKDTLYLVVLWPLVIPFFGFWLHTRRMFQALKDLDDRTE
jgi:hypothetical protein